MAFPVEFTPRAARLLKKLPAAVQERIRLKLVAVSENPAREVQRLTAMRAYKVRVGDYRVILDIDWDEEVVYVMWVGLRKAAY